MNMTGQSLTENSETTPGSNSLLWVAPAGLRPSDWRWQLARLSLQKRLPRRPLLRDPWVRRCRSFLRTECNKGQSCRRSRREPSDTVLSGAFGVRFGPDPLVAAELEARVLAGSSPELIGEHCGLSAESVAAYEALFFDVRPLLEATSYILHRVIGRPIIDGFSLSDLGSIWRFFGYMRGRHTLEVLLYTFPGREPRPWPASSPATPEQRARLIEACRGAVLTRCLPRVSSSVRHLKQTMELLAARSQARRAIQPSRGRGPTPFEREPATRA